MGVALLNGEEFSTLSLFIPPLNSLRAASETRPPFSPPPDDLNDFSFPMPPAAQETHAAAESIHRGRLLPFNFAPAMLGMEAEKPKIPYFKTEKPKIPPFKTEKPKIPFLNHRRAESYDGHVGGHRAEAQAADYQLLRRASSDPRPTPATRTWPFLVLGSVRFPAEMDMRDVRSRQRQRGLSEAVSKMAKHGGRSRWSILRALSCRATDSIAIS